jgi:hypothetical protein
MRNARFGALAVFTFLLAIVVILYVQDYDTTHNPRPQYEESFVVDTLRIE